MSLVLDAGRGEVTLEHTRLSHRAGSSHLGRRDSELSECRMFVKGATTRGAPSASASRPSATIRSALGWIWLATVDLRSKVITGQAMAPRQRRCGTRTIRTIAPTKTRSREWLDRGQSEAWEVERSRHRRRDLALS